MVQKEIHLRMAVLDPHGEVDRIFRGELAVENLNQAKPLDVVLQQRILQLTPFFPEEYERDLMERIPSCTSGRWHPAFTDITAKGADKGEGIIALTTHLGQNPQFTMAFGDGGNDISMIKAASSLSGNMLLAILQNIVRHIGHTTGLSRRESLNVRYSHFFLQKRMNNLFLSLYSGHCLIKCG